MSKDAREALLPPGMNDILPPDAGFEAMIVNRLLKGFASNGYEQVKPPLVEFEETLLGGEGPSMSDQTFRIMDPESRRMMGVRADMTLQIARIATTRLKDAPRPLRLCYAGQVLRVSGSQLRSERQFGQAGVELIGAESSAADAEIIALAADQLVDAGLKDLSVDLTVPTLVPAVCAAHGIDGADAAKARAALDRKDAAAVAALGGDSAGILGALLAAAGPAKRSLSELSGLDLPEAAKQECQRLADVVELVSQAVPGLTLTIDPVENRGFEYHSGISFVLFARNVRGELGRGGRYLAGNGGGEPATGFSLFMDTLMHALPGAEPAKRVFVAWGTPAADAAKLRQDGWVTVAAVDESDDVDAEARRMGCSHVCRSGKVVPVD